MKDQPCLICKIWQKHQTFSSEKSHIFDMRGNAVSIPLCYTHSIELFKRGQVNFMASYEERFKDRKDLSSNQNEIDQFNETRKKFLGNWFNRAS